MYPAHREARVIGRSTFSAAWSAALVVGSLAAGALSITGANATSLITDGNFANDITSGIEGLGFNRYSIGQYLPAYPSGNSPWIVNSGNVDFIGKYWQSPSGANPPSGTNGSVDLNGNIPGSISQTFTSPNTGLYDLTFSLSGNPDGFPLKKEVAVTIDSVTKDVFFILDGNTHSDMKYVAESLFFDVTSGLNTLTFASINTPGQYGAVIGNVSLTATPLPSTWSMLLAGFLGLGFIAYRGAKRRSAIAAA